MQFKNIFTLLLAVSFSQQVFAQESVNAGGGEIKGSGGTVSFSAGQVVFTTATGSSGTVAQGVQQPYTISLITENTAINDRIKFTVYPNPTTDKLILQQDAGKIENLSYQIFDVNGILMEKGTIAGISSSIIMEPYVAGMYFLKVMKGKEEFVMYKIIKN